MEPESLSRISPAIQQSSSRGAVKFQKKKPIKILLSI